MKIRKNYTPQEKVAILRAHLVDKVPTSHICAQFQLQSTILRKWLKQLFDNGAAALKRRPTIGKQPEAIQHRAADLNKQGGPFESREDELNWMISLVQDQFSAEQIKPALCAALGQQDIEKLLACIRDQPLKYRNRAVAILSYYRPIRVGHIAEFLRVSASSVDEWSRQFSQHGCCAVLPRQSEHYKAKDKVYQDAIFEILHAPPAAHGINRTTWRQEDVHSVMAKRGLGIAKANIRKIIKNAGYGYRKAKKVLTSNDPSYEEKLKNITRILRNLGPKEKFFSIDEYGPFAIKIHGGRSLVPIGHPRSVPQYQALPAI
jgi:transposase/transposase-like protein